MSTRSSNLRRPSAAAAALLLAAAVGSIDCDVSDSLNITLPEDLNVVVGSGNVVQETRMIGGFNGLRLEGVGAAALELGAAPALTIQADDNLMAHIRTEIVGAELVISTTPGRGLRPSEPIRYFVTATALASATLAGVGEIECIGLTAGNLRLESSGVGSVRFTQMSVQTLEAVLRGDGSMVTSGRAPFQSVRAGGIGSYNGRGLRSDEADVEVGGLGSATVRVRDRLVARVTGSGCVYYVGDPVVEAAITGSGCVERID